MTDPNIKKLETILELLKQNTSISVVKSFLKEKNLNFSAASWKDLFENRIIPAYRAENLTLASLIDILRDGEESGRQHVLLYETSQNNASSLMTERDLVDKLNKLGIITLLSEPKILEKPTEPTISDIRFEDNNNCLAIKIIETRESLVSVGEDVTDRGKFVTKKYERVQERAVNLFKLHENGVLEIRIASKTHSSRGYASDVERLWQYIEDIFPRAKFRVLSLGTAKNNIWDNRTELAKKIRYSDATLKDEYGYSVRAASNSKEADLSDNPAVMSSLDVFSSKHTYCDSNNIFFKPTEAGVPSKEVHLLISGEINEFAITANCDKADYDYVFNELRLLNRKVS